jgi:hypothetical protein
MAPATLVPTILTRIAVLVTDAVLEGRALMMTGVVPAAVVVVVREATEEVNVAEGLDVDALSIGVVTVSVEAVADPPPVTVSVPTLYPSA